VKFKFVFSLASMACVIPFGISHMVIWHAQGHRESPAYWDHLERYPNSYPPAAEAGGMMGRTVMTDDHRQWLRPIIFFAAFVATGVAPLQMQFTPTPSGGAKRPVVGAIRWDAWQDDGRVNAEVERTLGPQKWHSRLPFFAKVTGPDQVSIRGNSQAVMDQEIAYAVQAGLDYWAFVSYSPSSGMSNGLKLYLNSSHKSQIDFCLIIGSPSILLDRSRLVMSFQDSSYQKVLGNRPLLYFFQAQRLVGPDKAFATWEEAKAAFDALRADAMAAGAGNPYIVIQGWSASKDKQFMLNLGADAVGAYAVAGGSTAGSPYSSLADSARSKWEAAKEIGVPVVPLASAGWNRLPRYEAGGVWWEDGPRSNKYYLDPTPAELALHLKDAIDWVCANPAAAPANAVLIYAWNENDEGGWLVPTLKPDGSVDTSRVDALSGVIPSR